MVLQATKRTAENTPPVATPTGKSMIAKLRTSVKDAARRRRARINGNLTPKYVVEQAKRRSTTKSPANSINYKLKTFMKPMSPPPDVEMQDAEPVASSSRTVKVVDVSVMRELLRPEYREISREALGAVTPDLAETNIQFIHDYLREEGPSLLRALSGSKPSEPVSSALPKELSMNVEDLAVAPTHMMAVHGSRRSPESQERSKVTLFAVHSVVLAAHCAKLPPFPPSPVTSLSEKETPSGPSKVTIPVRSLCLPCPEMYPNLVSFLYTKQTSALLNSLLPCSPPPGFEEDPAKQLRSFATTLGETYTLQLLFSRMGQVCGLWKNACALGIFDNELWEVMDIAWEIYLHALAVGTKRQDLLDILSPPQPLQESQLSSLSSTSSSS